MRWWAREAVVIRVGGLAGEGVRPEGGGGFWSGVRAEGVAE